MAMSFVSKVRVPPQRIYSDTAIVRPWGRDRCTDQTTGAGIAYYDTSMAFSQFTCYIQVSREPVHI